ncbi:hypothetical protein INT08_05615 [Prosthecochloris sp. N3]|uniref:Signal transduction histidine kinase n=1 Tax=Prosthecochloris ethylica TaxID=2743976 RepID=A0ABR9XS37_9CHLB|nr:MULTISPECIES: LapA family protein [Prosthecochloris]MEC9486645.1 hypothetical protein [Prosthecochloris sp.]MBF0586747.1 hypothetical protein [Prosthecochloris ethylica]MBF0636653.1 hypothetical protein [Prosthecochloris ethylica]NUK47948.1 hypothetical protein [Prosthecochloris ethylica]RNA65250.1 hypothetical protein CR163_008445 [Prosthecochloris sp. ZM_2]
MKAHTITLVLVLFGVLLFAGVNWSLFSQPGSVNFLLYRIEAPLGIIMLGIVALMTALYIFFIGRTEVAALVRERKSSRALEEARDRADNSEKSRISALQAGLSEKIDGYGERIGALQDDMAAVDKRLRSLEETAERLVQRFDEEGVFIVRNGERSGDGPDDEAPAS